MNLENTSLSVIVVLAAGVIVAFGMLWDLYYRKNIRNVIDAVLSAIQYSIYYLFLILLLVIDWGSDIVYFLLAISIIVISLVIMYCRQKLVKNKISKEKLIGFVVAVALYGILRVIRIIFSESNFDTVAVVSYAIAFVFAIVILISLVDRRYKKYAQGALLAWVICVFIQTILSFFTKQIS